MLAAISFFVATVTAFATAAPEARAADRVLLFTKTAAYREDNIAPTRAALKNFLDTKGVVVDPSESAGRGPDSTLARYAAVIFLKTSGDALNAPQQTAFEKWFKDGGGFMGIHSALDTEYDWPFYGKLIGGAWYKSLAGDVLTKQTIVVEDTGDVSTRGLPKRWERTDEIYDFKANPRSAIDPKVHVLVTVDESTYLKGTPGKDHPMSWYDEYQGGRAWITAMGHSTASYSEPLFLGHVWGGLTYAMGRTTTAIAFPDSQGAQAAPAASKPLFFRWKTGCFSLLGRNLPN